MSKRRKPNKLTLRQESQAEDKELGIEHISEQMSLIKDVLAQNGINFMLWMEEYLGAAEKNGMSPPSNFEDYLPWNMTPEMKMRLSQDCSFQRGNAHFLQKANGTVYHILPDGSKKIIDLGSLTSEEYDSLTSA